MRMKKIVTTLPVLCLFLGMQMFSDNKTISQKISNQPIILESPLVAILHKIMPANAYGLMLQVRRKVRKLLYGVKGEDGMVGAYEYEGKMCSIKELANIERECEKNYHEKKQYLEANKSLYSDEEWEKKFKNLQNEYDEKKRLLRVLIEIAKEDFLAITCSYAGGANEMKKELLVLIEESFEKRGIEGESFMLKWEEEGHEGEVIRNELFTFVELEKHCHEFCNFMEDMARSCPKTKQRFLDLVRNSKNKLSI